MSAATTRDEGRLAYADHAWRRASELLAAADEGGAAEPEDLVRRATAAYLAGDDASASLWERAFYAYEAQADVGHAALCAFWLGRELYFRGEPARASGWQARLQRILDEDSGSYVARGYLVTARGIQCAQVGDWGGAATAFAEAAGVGRAFGDRSLAVWAQHGQGRAMLAQGHLEAGLALLDEVMVAVTSGEVAPILTGDVYCSVIDGLQEIFDIRRAAEWTAALSRWCDAQPEMVVYRGRCLVHRAEILRLHGSWPEAVVQAQDAYEQLSTVVGAGNLAAALYEQAELHRLRGRFDEAEDAYRRASEAGRTPQPGLALLRLAQGRTAPAAAALRALDDAPQNLRQTCTVLAACVEVLLADGDLAHAASAAEELAAVAAGSTATVLQAMAGQATGAVLLASGDNRAALTQLRRAAERWQAVDAPYEAARTRVLVGLACRSLGDEDSALLELEGARRTFEALGAGPDAARAGALQRPAGAGAAGGLTSRELEVLLLVAQGRTNREVATALVISEKTVARHVSNIFRKLEVSSRSAATAYAFEHHLR